MKKIWGCLGDQSILKDSDCLDETKTFVINGKTIKLMCHCIFQHTVYNTHKKSDSSMLLMYNIVQWNG